MARTKDGAELQRIRKVLGFTYRKMAQTFDIPESTLYDYFAGRRGIPGVVFVCGHALEKLAAIEAKKTAKRA